MTRTISFDIMIGDRYYHTMKAETMKVLEAIVFNGTNNERPIISQQKLRREVERRLPNLKDKDYCIVFNTKV